MIWFTSDLHLGHNSIIWMQNRPFADAVKMNEALIANYNSVVKKNDTVYILGDLCYKMTVQEANNTIAKLNGKKILIQGNHDKEYDKALFDHISDFEQISTNGMHLVLMHYPLLSWPRSMRGSIQLHGHVHSDGTYNLENVENGIRRYDVGVDANNYFPVSVNKIEEIFRSMDTQNPYEPKRDGKRDIGREYFLEYWRDKE